MSLIIRELQLTDESYSFLDNDEKIDILKGLSKVNLFVGENNSGKSLLLRKIFSDQEIKFIPTDDTLQNLNNSIIELKETYAEYCIHNPWFPKTTISSFVDPVFKDISSIDFLVMGKDANYYLNDLFELIEKLKKQPQNTSQFNVSYKQMGLAIINIINESFENNNISLNELELNYNTNNTYIPILRGLRPLNYGNDSVRSSISTFFKDIYEIRTKEDYGFDDDSNIFSGLKMYDILHELKNGDYENRSLVEEFENYLGGKFF